MRNFLPLVITLAGIPAALADPPLTVDDAYIADPGRCQVEGQMRRERGGGREQAMEFGCGVSEWLELTVGRASSRTTLLQAKVLPLTMDKSPYGYGFTFGAAGSDPFINLIGGVKLPGDRAAVYANVGAVRDRRENLTRPTAGIAGEYSVNPTLQLVAEVTAVRGVKPAPLAGVRLFPVPEHMHFTIAAGRRSTTVGFHWDF